MTMAVYSHQGVMHIPSLSLPSQAAVLQCTATAAVRITQSRSSGKIWGSTQSSTVCMEQGS